MNKQGLSLSLSEYLNITRKEAETNIEGLLLVILKTLKAGDKISLNGFGSFEVRQRKPRIGINPATKKPLKIKASLTIGFKPSKVLKDELNKK